MLWELLCRAEQQIWPMRRRPKRILNCLCTLPAWLIPEVAEALYQIEAALKACLSNSSRLADLLTEAVLHSLQCSGCSAVWIFLLFIFFFLIHVLSAWACTEVCRRQLKKQVCETSVLKETVLSHIIWSRIWLCSSVFTLLQRSRL